MSRTRIRRRLYPVVVALMLASCSVLVSPAAAQPWQSIPPNPNITVNYLPPASPEYQGVYQRLKERQVLEELQHFLAPLHLPHPLQLLATDGEFAGQGDKNPCQHGNAFYSSSHRSLILCYQLVKVFEDRAPQTVSKDGFTRQNAIIGGLTAVLMHESGHMIFDMFDVPIFGREEDAADQMASFIALQFNVDVERTIIKGLVYQTMTFFRDPTAAAPMRFFSDEHGTASQRMYNTLCLAYGGDRQTFQEFVDRGWLPKTRAAGCRKEFEQLKFAFETTVLPFIDQRLMSRVKQTQWLTPEELK